MKPAKSMQQGQLSTVWVGDDSGTCRHWTWNQDHSWPNFKLCNNNYLLLQSDWKHQMASWFPEITTYTISINVPLYVSYFAEMHVNVDRAHLQAPNHSASQAALCCRHEYIPKQRSIAHPFPSIYTAPRLPGNPVSKQWHINPLRMHAL